MLEQIYSVKQLQQQQQNWKKMQKFLHNYIPPHIFQSVNKSNSRSMLLWQMSGQIRWYNIQLSVNLLWTLQNLFPRDHKNLPSGHCPIFSSFWFIYFIYLSWIMRASDHQRNMLSTVRTQNISPISNLGRKVIFKKPPQNSIRTYHGTTYQLK